MSMNDQGKCWVCGVPLDRLTEEEDEAALAEAKANFPDQNIDKMDADDELGKVCDSCYRAFMVDFEANPEKYRNVIPEKYQK